MKKKKKEDKWQRIVNNILQFSNIIIEVLKKKFTLTRNFDSFLVNHTPIYVTLSSKVINPIFHRAASSHDRFFSSFLTCRSINLLNDCPVRRYYYKQDKIFRRKRQSTGTNFVHVYLEIWDEGILKFNKFSLWEVKKEQQCDSLMYAYIKCYKISYLK